MDTENHNVYFNTRDELTKVCLTDVMYAESDGNYISLKLRSGRSLSLLASLQSFLMITEAMTGTNFVQVGRSHVVNKDYISQVNTLRRVVVLADDATKTMLEVKVTKDAIRQLKQLLMDAPRQDISDFHAANCNMEAFQIID